MQVQKKKIGRRAISLLMTLAMLLGMLPAITVGASAALSGSGTKESPYLIATADDLISLSGKDLAEGVYYKQTADIDLNNAAFTPITSLAGTYSGGGYVIKNLKITVTDGDTVGLFRRIYSTGTLMGLGLVSGAVTGGNGDTGALCGQLDGGLIYNCYNSGVSVKKYMLNCAGGLTGKILNTGRIVNSWTSGNVSGANHVGGIVGWVDKPEGVVVSNCYSSGVPSNAGKALGGIFGTLGAVNPIVEAHFDHDIAGVRVSAGVITNGAATGGRGRDTSVMKSEGFTQMLNDNRATAAGHVGLNTSDLATWAFNTNGYPTLQIEKQHAAPTGLSGYAATASASGYISGTTTAMEYKISGSSTYTTCTATKTNVIKPGTYYVRYKGDYLADAGVDKTVTVAMGSQSTPSAPTLSSKNASQIVLKTVSGQQYYYSTTNATSGSTVSFTATGSTYTVSNLTGGTTYYFFTRKAATSVLNASSWSGSLSVTTDKAAQSAPTGLSGVAATSSASGYLKGTTTTMEYRISGSSSYTACTATNTNVPKAGTYYVRYKATSTANAGSDATVTVALGTPSVPSAPTLSSKNASQIVLKTVSGQQYYYSTTNATSGSTVSFTATGSTYTVSNLTGGTTYYFFTRKVATDALNTSSWSGSLSVTTDKADQSAPAGLSGVPATESAKAYISGTTAAMEYKIEGATSYTTCAAPSTNVPKAGTYHVRFKEIATTNASGDATVTVALGTQVAPETPVENSKTANEIVLQTVKGQEYYYGTTDDASGAEVSFVGTGDTHTVTGLTGGATYYFFARKVATDSLNPSPWSVSRSITMHKEFQAPPMGLSGVAADKGVSAYISGTTTTMEYRTDSIGAAYRACTEGKTDLSKAGTYHVRFKETATNNASGDTKVTVALGEQEAVRVGWNITGKFTLDTTGLQAVASGGNGTGGYVYASSNPGVATVDAATGAITILDIGATDITAYRAADENYEQSATATIPLNIELTGLGTQEDPYKIRNEKELRSLSAQTLAEDVYYLQTEDILMDGDHFVPVTAINGVYDGGGHSISNLQISESSGGHVGLFRAIGAAGTVKNLGIASGKIESSGSNQNTGAIAGDLLGKLYNCYNKAAVSRTHGTYCVGGIVGGTGTGGVVINCWNSGTVTGDGSTSKNTCAGGIAGWLNGTIINSYSYGEASGYQSLGNIAAGGGGRVINCYYSTSSGTAEPGNSAGVVGLTTEEMQSPSFAAMLNGNRGAAATESGVEESALRYWMSTGSDYPALSVAAPIVFTTSVSGEAIVGKTLTGSTTPSATSVFAYEWQKEDLSTGAWVAIANQTGPTLIVPADCAGRNVRLKVVGKDGYTGEAYSEPLAITGPTSAPENLIIEQQPVVNGEAKLNLTWEQPLSLGGGTISKYVVSYTQKDGSSTTIETIDTKAVLSLLPGRQYEIYVYAVNGAGNGAPTETKTVWADYPPKAPTEVTATRTNDGADRIVITWAPAVTEGTAVTAYRVYYAESAESTSKSSGETILVSELALVDGKFSYTVGGLNPGTKYEVTVMALNTGCESPVSTAAFATPCTVSDAVGEYTVTHTPTGGLIATGWTAPDNKGSSISKYYLYYTTDAAALQGDLSGVDYVELTDLSSGMVLEVPADMVEKGKLYYVALQAVNGIGKSALSEVKSVTTANVAGKPEITALTSPEKYTLAVTVDSLDNNGSYINTWNLNIYREDEANPGEFVHVGHTSVTRVDRALQDVPTLVVTQYIDGENTYSLEAGANYKVAVQAQNSVSGASEWSEISATAAMVQGRPAQMEQPKLTVQADGTVVFDFVRPATHANDDNLAMGYHLYLYSDAECQTQAGSANVTDGTLTGSIKVAPGVYYAVMTAENDMDVSVPSTPVPVNVSTLTVDYGTTPMSYIQGERFNPAGMTVTLNRADGTSQAFDLSKVEDFDALAADNIKIYTGNIQIAAQNQRLDILANGGKLSVQRVEADYTDNVKNSQMLESTNSMVVKRVTSTTISGTLVTSYSVGERLNFTTKQSPVAVRLNLSHDGSTSHQEVKFADFDRYGVQAFIAENLSEVISGGGIEITAQSDKAIADYNGKRLFTKHVTYGSAGVGASFVITELDYTSMDILYNPAHETVATTQNPFGYSEGELLQMEGMIVQFKSSATADMSLSPLFIYLKDGFRPVKHADLTDSDIPQSIRTELAKVVAVWGIETLDGEFDIGLDTDLDGLSDGFNSVFGTEMKVCLAHGAPDTAVVGYGLTEINHNTAMSTVLHNGRGIYAIATSTKGGAAAQVGADNESDKDGEFFVAGRSVDYIEVSKFPTKTSFIWGSDINFGEGENDLRFTINYTAGLPEKDVSLEMLKANNGIPLEDGYWYGITNVAELYDRWVNKSATWSYNNQIITLKYIDVYGEENEIAPSNIQIEVTRNTLTDVKLRVDEPKNVANTSCLKWNGERVSADVIEGQPMSYDNIFVRLTFANGDVVDAPYGGESTNPNHDYVWGYNMGFGDMESEAIVDKTWDKRNLAFTYKYYEGEQFEETVTLPVQFVFAGETITALPPINVIQDFKTADVVSNLKAEVSKLREITLTWDQIGEDRGATHGNGTISAYEVYCPARTGNKVLKTVPVEAGKSPAATITAADGIDILDASTYEFTIKAINQHGLSTTAAAIPSVTTWSVPQVAPATVTGRHIGSVEGKAGHIAMTWSEIDPSKFDGEFKGYALVLTSVLTGESWTFSAGTDATKYDIFITDAMAKMTYFQVTVAAVSEVGTGVVSREVATGVISDVPGAVSELNMTGATDQTVTVSWEAPVYTGGAAIDGYNIYVWKNDGWVKQNVSLVSTTSYQIAGLAANTVYRIGVLAKNGPGESVSMVEIEVATTALPASPVATQALMKEIGADDYLNLRWTGAALNGAAAIHKYVVYARPLGGSATDYVEMGTLTLDAPVTESALSETTVYSYDLLIADIAPTDGTKALVKGQSYQFAVSAVNEANGVGSKSKPIDAIARVVQSLKVVTSPKLSYIDGESLSLSKMTVKLVYTDGTESAEIPFAEFENSFLEAKIDLGDGIFIKDGTGVILANSGRAISLTYTFRPDAGGSTYQQVAYGDSLVIQVKNKQIEHLDVKTGPATVMTHLQPVDLAGLQVEIFYDNGQSGGYINLGQFADYNIKVNYNGQLVEPNNLESELVRIQKADGKLIEKIEIYAVTTDGNSAGTEWSLKVREKTATAIDTIATALPNLSFAGGSTFAQDTMGIEIAYDNAIYGGENDSTTYDAIKDKVTFFLMDGTTEVSELVVGTTPVSLTWKNMNYHVEMRYQESKAAEVLTKDLGVLTVRDAAADRVEIITLPTGINKIYRDGQAFYMAGLQAKIHLENDTYMVASNGEDVFELAELLSNNAIVKLGTTAITSSEDEILLNSTLHDGKKVSIEWKENGVAVPCEFIGDGTNMVTVRPITSVALAGRAELRFVEGQSLDFSKYNLRIEYKDDTNVNKVVASISLDQAISEYNLEVYYIDDGKEVPLENGTAMSVEEHNGRRVYVRNVGNKVATQLRMTTVIDLSISSITVETPLDSATTYYEGDQFDFTNLAGSVEMNNGTRYDLTGAKLRELAEQGYLTMPALFEKVLDAGTVSTVPLSFKKVDYSTDADGAQIKSEVTVELLKSPVTVLHRVGTGFGGNVVSLSGQYVIGQMLDMNGVTVTIQKNDGSTDTIVFSTTGITLTNSKSGSQSLTWQNNELALGQYGKLFVTTGTTADKVVSFKNGDSTSKSEKALTVDDHNAVVYVRYQSSEGYGEVTDRIDVGTLDVSQNTATEVIIDALPTMKYVENAKLDLSDISVKVMYRLNESEPQSMTYEQAVAAGVTFYANIGEGGALVQVGGKGVTEPPNVTADWNNKNLTIKADDASVTPNVRFTVITQAPAPKTAQVLSSNHNSAKLQWQAPDDLKNGTIDSFVIYRNKVGGVQDETPLKVKALDLTAVGDNKLYTYTVEALDIGTDYTFDVAVETEWGIGEIKTTDQIHTWSVPISEPKSLSYDSVGYKVNWVAPEWTDPNFSASLLLGYEITITEIGNSENVQTVRVSAEKTSFDVTDTYFEGGKTYKFEIAAFNAAGVNPTKTLLNSNISLNQVPVGGPKTPVPGVSGVEYHSFLAAWVASTGETYVANLYADSALANLVKTVDSGNTGSAEFSGLTPNTTYYLVVVATKNEMTASSVVMTVETKQLPAVAAPANVVVLAGDQKLNVTWDKATDAASYTVHVSYANDEGETVDVIEGITVDQENASAEIVGLTNGTEYTVQVSATGNGVDTLPQAGEKSTPVKATPVVATLVSIAITQQPTKTQYTVGDTFDATGMVVTATYSDGSIQILAASEYTLDKTEALTLTDTTVTVTFEGKTATVTISVSELPVEPTGVTVSGLVKSYNPKLETKIYLFAKGVDTSDVSKATYTGVIEALATGSGQVEQSFNIIGVAAGTYTLVIKKTAHLDYTVTGVVVQSEDLDFMQHTRFQTFGLIVGDLNGDGAVNATDQGVITDPANYNMSAESASNVLTDLNSDGAVNATDEGLITSGESYNKTAINDATFSFQ